MIQHRIVGADKYKVRIYLLVQICYLTQMWFLLQVCCRTQMCFLIPIRLVTQMRFPVALWYPSDSLLIG